MAADQTNPAARWAAAAVLGLLGALAIVRGLLSPAPQTLNPAAAAHAPVGTPDPSTPSPAAPAPTAAPKPAPSPASPTRLININTATAAELDLLPGIGPVTAARIIEYREIHGPFRSLDDLDNVTRIGPKTIADLAPYATAQ